MGDVEGALEKWREALATSDGEAEPQLAIAIALYAQGERDEGVQLGETALRSDQRYAEVEFLRANLWGDRLLSEAEAFLDLPQIRETVAQISNSSSPEAEEIPDVEEDGE
jgi:tetratricopeptide (TPR) repeat protein